MVKWFEEEEEMKKQRQLIRFISFILLLQVSQVTIIFIWSLQT